MRDADVRSELYDRLLPRTADGKTRVVSEMGLWSGSVRIDVAVIGGELEGFEIKSDRDTLSRLTQQADIYGMIFDRLTLVCGSRHTEKATAAIPDWWGITEATAQGNGYLLSQVRRPDINPAPSAVRIAGLLWKDEAIDALRKNGVAVKSSWRLRELHAALAEAIPPDELRAVAREAILDRKEWLARHDPFFVGPHRDRDAPSP